MIKTVYSTWYTFTKHFLKHRSITWLSWNCIDVLLFLGDRGHSKWQFFHGRRWILSGLFGVWCRQCLPYTDLAVCNWWSMPKNVGRSFRGLFGPWVSVFGALTLKENRLGIFSRILWQIGGESRLFWTFFRTTWLCYGNLLRYYLITHNSFKGDFILIPDIIFSECTMCKIAYFAGKMGGYNLNKVNGFLASRDYT